MTSAPGFHDVRGVYLDRDDTLYAKHDCMPSGIDTKACSGQTVRVLVRELSALCAGTAEASDLMRARLPDLSACFPYRWVAGN